MLESDFEGIAVEALCKRARTNKKTFYHYETLKDLMAEVMAQGWGVGKSIA